MSNARSCFVFTLFGISFSLQGKTLVDGMVAQVGKAIVLKSEVEQRVRFGPLVLVSDFPSRKEDPPETRALNDLINLKLIEASAKDIDIVVTSEQVEDQIQEVLSKNHSSQEELVEYLQGQNKTLDQYRDDVRSQMILMRFKGRVILPSIHITQADLQRQYIKVYGQPPTSEKLMLMRAVFKSKDEEGHKRATDLYEKLKGGMSYDESKTYFTDAQYDTQPVPYMLGDLQPSLRSAIEPLVEHGASPPLQTSLGWIVFYVDSRTAALSREEKMRFDSLEKDLRVRDIERKTEDWLQRARTTSKVRVITP